MTEGVFIGKFKVDHISTHQELTTSGLNMASILRLTHPAVRNRLVIVPKTYRLGFDSRLP